MNIHNPSPSYMIPEISGSSIIQNDTFHDASSITNTTQINTTSGTEKEEEKKNDTKSSLHDDDEESSIAITAIDKEEKLPTATTTLEEPYTMFSMTRLIQFLFLTSLSAMISPLTGSIYFPSTNQIESDVGVTTEEINLSITVYMVFQGLSPTFWGTIADSYGRRPVLLITLTIYCGSCVGLALSPNYAALMVFRMLQAFGSSSVIAVSAGVLSDTIEAKKRGTFYGVYSLGQLLGTVLGPVLGGIISQELGWRWIFWILLIWTAALAIGVFFVVPETLRSLVGDGSGYANPTPTQWLARRRGLLDEEKIAAIKTANGPRKKMNFLTPFKYFTEPDLLLILWYNGLMFTAFYCFMTSTTKQFSIHYPFLSEAEIGVCFLAMGVGTISGSFIRGRILDHDYRVEHKKFKSKFPDKPDTEFPIFYARFKTVWINILVMNVVVILYGWMLNINAPLAVPLVLQFLFGISFSGAQNSCQNLLIDLMPSKGASITSSNNVMRCLLGAVSSIYIDPGISGIGNGWMFTILGIALAANNICVPVLLKMGPKWRQARLDRQVRLDRQMNVAKL